MFKKKCLVITHRGLEPSNKDFYPESSFEAFKNHLERGFGIEFDVNFAKEGLFVFHDSDLSRISKGADKRLFSEISLEEIRKIQMPEKASNVQSLSTDKLTIHKKARFATFQEVLDLIRKSSSELNALHLKGKYQTEFYLNLLIKVLENNKDILNKIFIFDVKPETAIYLKSKIKELSLAPSVSHPYDILRFNDCVGKTLFSIEDAVNCKKQGLYDWVWMDEWDLLDENKKEKKLYTKENFELLKKYGYKIGLVTPEMHTTSPGLYGGESHPDARDKETLFRRIREIINLNPDAICTDNPEEVRKIIFDRFI